MVCIFEERFTIPALLMPKRALLLIVYAAAPALNCSAPTIVVPLCVIVVGVAVANIAVPVGTAVFGFQLAALVNCPPSLPAPVQVAF